jgi:hypothetical protein
LTPNIPEKLLVNLCRVIISKEDQIAIRFKINKKPDTFRTFPNVLELYFIAERKISRIPQSRYDITLGCQFVVNGPAPDLTGG